MPARLTAAEARKLGIDTKASGKVRTRTTAKGPYCTRCVTCGTVFHTMAAEDRHLVDTHHGRYEMIWGATA